MNLFRTQDNSKALKRADHWIGTFITIALFTGAYFAAKHNVDAVEELKKIMPTSKI